VSGEPGIERVERPLNDAERRWLRLHLVRLDCARVNLRRWVWATAVVLVPIWFLAVLARPRDAGFATALLVAVAFVINAWSGLTESTATRRRRDAARAALEYDRAVEVRVRCRALVRIEELDDCGDCWLLDVGDDTTLVLWGQEYYAHERFPSDDFSLVEIRQSNERAFRERIVPRGARIHARHTFPASALRALELEPELRVTLPRALRDIEAELRGAPDDGRYR